MPIVRTARPTPWALGLVCACLVPVPAASTLAAAASPAPALDRLLCETHCIACHDTEVHWRDKRAVRDWYGLRAQVITWQARLRLGWRKTDSLEVVQHLDETIYRLPKAGRQRSQGPRAARSTAGA